MQKVIEELKKDKNTVNQKAFLQALSNHNIYLAEMPLNVQKSTNNLKLFIEHDNNGIGYLLGFTSLKYFKNWQQHHLPQNKDISIKPINFEDLCVIMTNLQENETALILNPMNDNLILENALFHEIENIKYDVCEIHDNQCYVAMSPLEQGEFSFELLQLLLSAFNKESWISNVWAATIDIDMIESFLLIIESKSPTNEVDYNKREKILYQHLLDSCKPFLGKAKLKILSSTIPPFNEAILNYDPIFARKQELIK